MFYRISLFLVPWQKVLSKSLCPLLGCHTFSLVSLLVMNEKFSPVSSSPFAAFQGMPPCISRGRPFPKAHSGTLPGYETRDLVPPPGTSFLVASPFKGNSLCGNRSSPGLPMGRARELVPITVDSFSFFFFEANNIPPRPEHSQLVIKSVLTCFSS